jgi:hypothetical protein
MVLKDFDRLATLVAIELGHAAPRTARARVRPLSLRELRAAAATRVVRQAAS